VQDWITSVLNPMIAALERSLELLPQGPGRWDFRTRDFVDLHPIAEYVEPAYQPNFQDLVDKHPNLVEPLERHDVLLQRLRTATEVAHARLVSCDEGKPFRAAVEQAMAMRPGEDVLRSLAAHVVSGYREVPRDLPHAAIYNPGGLLAVRGRSCVVKELEQQANAAGELAKFSASLAAQLKVLRTELADRFRVRIVPVVK
jgi:hypothetical protein